MKKASISFFAIMFLVSLVSLALVSCSGSKQSKPEKKEEASAAKAGEDTLSYVSDDISIGLFFDKEGTRRTLHLDKGQKEFTGYLIVQFPEYMEVAAIEWKLDMPPGVEIDTDKYRKEQIMTLGQIPHGLSERFDPCLEGPSQIVHTLTFRITGDEKLENATFTVLPSENGNFVGIAECIEGFPQRVASAYKAVVNPTE